ncbi:MAG TPA: sensor histidine kinase [Polyangiaceae bacterium]|nr:sensor histidine kinase [Polyangiaceae bacterium]
MADSWVASASAGATSVRANDLLPLLDVLSDPLLRVSSSGLLLAFRPSRSRCDPADILPDLSEAVGQKLEEWLPPEVATLWRKHLAEALTSGQPQEFDFEWHAPRGAFWLTARMNASAHADEALVVLRDRSRERRLNDENAQLKAALEEKDTLLREVHHRIKNHLQVISSLLNIQLNRTDQRQARVVLEEAGNRVRSISILHESLYQHPLPSRVDMREYVSKLVRNLTRTYVGVSHRVLVRDQIAPLALPVDLALPCGLIVNELLTNAFKYAFPSDRRAGGEVRLSLTGSGPIELRIEDDGVGVSDVEAWRHASSVGMSLVRALSRQLDARLELKSDASGTSVRTIFDPDRASALRSVPPLSSP